MVRDAMATKLTPGLFWCRARKPRCFEDMLLLPHASAGVQSDDDDQLQPAHAMTACSLDLDNGCVSIFILRQAYMHMAVLCAPPLACTSRTDRSTCKHV